MSLASSSEVADLDNLLGFKGNYLIFPLKEAPCYLTQFMMQEYVDDYLGLHDPDPFGSYTTEELLDYIECIRSLDDTTDDDLVALRDMLIERLTSPRGILKRSSCQPASFLSRPSGQHPLEDFKLYHRALDVKKVRAEVRQAELENLRRAARLLVDEREDPDIDKRILIQGSAPIVVTP